MISKPSHLAFLYGVFFAVLFFSQGLQAGTLKLETVLKSSAEHFPEVKAALARVEEREGDIMESLGAFDASVESSYYRRLDGFYSGRISDTKIVKPLREFGAKASVGYRVSDGLFPVYEDYFFTNESGELNASLSLSLLRNRDIDPARFKLFQSEIELDQTKIDLLGTKISVQMQAYKAYLDWVAAGRKYDVYKSLLEIATSRQDAIKQKAERGDVPDIAVTENRQFILQRRETVLDAERQFQNAGNKLSLFLRDENGFPVVPKVKDLPKSFPKVATIKPDEVKKEIGAIMQQNPDIKRLETQKQAAQNNVALGQNNILPAVDLELTAADDLGSDNGFRDEAESTVRVSVSVPLQKRLGQGRINKGEAIKRQVENRKSLALEKMQINFDNIINNMRTAKNIVKVTEEEIDVTQRMEDAERTMFDNGQSDFFLVNIREINQANAKINNIQATQYLASVYADYLSMTLNLDQLYISQP